MLEASSNESQVEAAAAENPLAVVFRGLQAQLDLPEISPRHVPEPCSSLMATFTVVFGSSSSFQVVSRLGGYYLFPKAPRILGHLLLAPRFDEALGRTGKETVRERLAASEWTPLSGRSRELRQLLLDLGPCYVKLGQVHLSSVWKGTKQISGK